MGFVAFFRRKYLALVTTQQYLNCERVTEFIRLVDCWKQI